MKWIRESVWVRGLVADSNLRVRDAELVGMCEKKRMHFFMHIVFAQIED